MAKFIKIHIDAKRRRLYNLKTRRLFNLKNYLGIIYNTPQIARFKNYCQVTTASRGYYSQFALSRHCLRKFTNFGSIPGVTKSSW